MFALYVGSRSTASRGRSRKASGDVAVPVSAGENCERTKQKARGNLEEVHQPEKWLYIIDGALRQLDDDVLDRGV